MNKVLFLFFISVFSPWLVRSQSFTNEREKFVKEFQKATDDAGKGDSEFAKKSLQLFLLEGSSCPADNFAKMVNTANALFAAKRPFYPDVYNYVESIYGLITLNQSPKNWENYHAYIDKCLTEKKAAQITSFVSIATGLFNRGTLAQLADTRWLVKDSEFLLEMENTEPVFNFSKATLVSRHKSSNGQKDGNRIGDAEVVQTAGVFRPSSNTWTGKGGKITWEKVGLDKSKTFAEVNNYAVRFNTVTFIADSVLLTTPYFSTPVMGLIVDNPQKNLSEEDMIFPNFVSYKKELEIKNIAENVDYLGPFVLEGAKLIGKGTKANPTSIIIKRNDVPLMKIRGESIKMTPEKIAGSNVKFVLYLDNDSIFHNRANLTYSIDKKFVEIQSEEISNISLPFTSSYHQLDMYVPKLDWKTDENELIFTYDYGVSQQQRYARFESLRYFDPALYDRLQGLWNVHPLVALSQHVAKTKETTFSEGKAATALGATVEQVKSVLIELAVYGFIEYDLTAKTITVKPKLDNFVKGKAGTRDYDYLNFEMDCRPKSLNGYDDQQIKNDPYLQEMKAHYEKQNYERSQLKYLAKLNLNTKEIELVAIDVVKLSGPKNVAVFPDKSQITLQNDRNFIFSGWTNAGKMETKVLSGQYLYKENKIRMLKTDQSFLNVKPLQEADGKRPIQVVTPIRFITGDLFVDEPGNRAGINPKFQHFPKMKLAEPAYVYYNEKTLFGGAYDSSRFYYTVTPVEFDSLHNFNEKAFRLKGALTSAGIFPTITEDLKIMPDYSLGFSTKAPEAGYEFYGLASKYQNRIVLSANGLQGEGTINWVSSTAISKKLTFLPDSTVGLANFTCNPVETGVEFPDVAGEGAFICFVPKGKVLKAYSTEKTDLKYFKGDANLKGVAFVREDGMTASGDFYYTTAINSAKLFTFSRWEIMSDSSMFSLINTFAEKGEQKIAFQAENVKTHVSFKDRKGDFSLNKGASKINFPVNQYACKLDRFAWSLDKSELFLEQSAVLNAGADKNLDVVEDNFTSTHPEQANLGFNSSRARYDLKDRSIFCENVPYVIVADSKIFPDSQKVTIRKAAFMEPFKNAGIITSYVTKYHKIAKADVAVTSRNEFSGTGEYNYFDKDSTMTLFKLTSIKVEKSSAGLITTAIGNVTQEENFKLSKEFDFYGGVKIISNEPFLNFNGATRINHECAKFEKNWMSFNAPIDPKNIQIPVSANMLNLTGEKISAGFVWRNATNPEEIQMYPTFLSKLTDPVDNIAMTASGFLQYKKTERGPEYQIAPKERLVNENEAGNFLAMNTETCSMTGKGELINGLGLELVDVDVEAVGDLNFDQSNGLTTMDLTIAYNFAIDKGVVQNIANKLNQLPDKKSLDLSSGTLQRAILTWSDQKTLDKIKSDFLVDQSLKKLPEKMEKTIILTGVKLATFDREDAEEKGLISTTSDMSIVNMFEKPVMQKVIGRVFFQQTFDDPKEDATGADMFAFQFEFPGLEYFFRSQTNANKTKMQIKSSDAELMTAINGIKPDKRKTKKFEYETSTQDIIVEKFRRLFQ
jgi:hypothetical protein